MAVVPFWRVVAGQIGASPVGVLPTLIVLAGVAAALYRLVRTHRFGWAIAGFAAPALAASALLLVAALGWFLDG